VASAIKPRRQREVAGGPTREHVGEIQRSRILTAMAEVAAEQGVGAATVERVVARAGVSRRTFYDLFDDREGCFMAAFELALARGARDVLPAWQAPGTWRDRVRAALTALLVFMDEEPALARLCVVQALGAGPRALERRGEVLRAMTAAVDEGRRGAREGTELPPLAADGVLGGVLSIVHARLLEGGGEPLTGLVGELMSMIVLPYQGPAAARKELHRPAPSFSKPNNKRNGDPLAGLEMRITYRTVRVLMVIASHPAASNRQIAEHAGIADQGQVSKLLTRLQHLGLIDNHGDGPTKGAPNAWQLTPKGRQVEQAINLQNTTAG
jgi:AcrR family transcriptional regulator/DNA-binding MarR family transcriptional regulator